MKKIRDTSSPPPGRAWTYTDPDSGYVLTHAVYKVLFNEAKKYRQLNHFPVGLLFQEQFDQILCAHAPGACFEFTPPSLMDKAASLAKAMSNWAKAGFKLRSQEAASRCLDLCRACDHYGGENGVMRVVCKICGCSKKKVAFASEHCPLKPPKW
jgi:hypothetical protein